MGSLKRKHGPFSPSPSRRRYKVTLLQLLMTVKSEAYQARGIECDSMNTTKLYTDMPEHTSRLSKASCFTAPQNQTCTSPRERTTATNHRCTKNYAVSSNHGACRCSTSPFPQPTAMRSPAHSIVCTTPGARKKATARLFSAVGLLCFNACVRCTSTRLSFLVTTNAPTVCLAPLLLVKVKVNLSPSNSAFCAPHHSRGKN